MLFDRITVIRAAILQELRIPFGIGGDQKAPQPEPKSDLSHAECTPCCLAGSLRLFDSAWFMSLGMRTVSDGS